MLNTSSFIKGLVAAFVVSVVGDMLWHNVLFADFYNQRLMRMTGGTVPGFSAFIIVVELLAAAVTTYFVLAAARKRTAAEGAFHGALIGFAMVGAVNFLNHALFPLWDATLVSVDTAWGVLLGAAAGASVIAVVGRK